MSDSTLHLVTEATPRPKPVRLRLPGTIAEIEASPAGPQVGAFFDFDGTLIAGYSAAALAADQWERRDVDLGDVARAIKGALRVGAGLADVTEFMRLSARSWRGRADVDLHELGERVFTQKIVDLIYPEAVEIVRAHQHRGHTVVLSSSALPYQVRPIADYLGIEEVLCTELEVVDGMLTGQIAGEPLWGAGKSDAVQAYAGRCHIDLAQSYFYADGDEDTGLMHLVGKPRPTNPGKHLAAVARRRNWPVQRFTSRGPVSPATRARSLAGFFSVVPIAAIGGGIGLLRGSKRAALDFVSEQWFSTLLHLAGVTINVVGEQNLWAQRPAVFVFNHRTNFDGFIAAALVRTGFTAVAKRELEHDPFVGTLGRLADVAFVDRGNTSRAIESLEPLLAHLKTRGISILAAPEGTRVAGTAVGEFKKGPFRMAMAAGVPIVPIIIRNADVLGARGATVLRPGVVDVVVGEPISVTDWTVEDLGERIAGVRQLFVDTLADWPAQ
ncbi:HAD-IB family hydrolase [Mycobacterium sp. M1]|uniref:HAD-IB family hydrolase n=1 Tax=Mycolicibacter acidiphilus TaxID=2835306 RepID=A0ABS5RLH3_9MYCO|nr:HAD-IB family hydrolase [Mycolicibacter acidiphilus]MBS9534428.1 HAD-IB family hydrolase [Mycolicibacter acidiphilus]